MRRASSRVEGRRVRDGPGPDDVSFGIAKCAVARTCVKLELRWSNEYGALKEFSSSVAVPGMAFRKKPEASTRIALLSGCGSLATGAEASRLSVKLSRAARASGVPSLA